MYACICAFICIHVQLLFANHDGTRQYMYSAGQQASVTRLRPCHTVTWMPHWRCTPDAAQCRRQQVGQPTNAALVACLRPWNPWIDGSWMPGKQHCTSSQQQQQPAVNATLLDTRLLLLDFRINTSSQQQQQRIQHMPPAPGLLK